MPVYNQTPAPATEDDGYHMSRWLAEWGIDLDGPDETDDELEARAAAGDEADPECWGDEWDEFVWVPNDPPADEPEPFTPAEGDRAWWAGQDLADELDERAAWLEYEEWAARMDAMAAAAGLAPQDIAGCVHEMGDLA